MLHQEINLYQAFKGPSDKGVFLTWQRFWLSNLMIAILFALMYGGFWLHYQWLTHQKMLKQTQLTQLQKQFNQMKKGFPALLFTKDSTQTLKELQEGLQAQQKILANIASQMYFSQVLTAFAKDIVPNVWLTGITITQGGQSVLFKGNSLGLDDLQKFLNQVQADGAFKNYYIRLSNVQKSEINKIAFLTFQIALVKKNQ